MKWFETYRMDWIFEMVQIYKFINREHLVKKFKISNIQASIDLRTYQKLHPNTIFYNVNSKRYEKLNDRIKSRNN